MMQKTCKQVVYLKKEKFLKITAHFEIPAP